MDLIFKRYSSPFSLIDPLIENNQFSDFITTFNDKVIEDIEFEYWLHRIFDKSFIEYRDKIHSVTKVEVNMSEEEIKATLNKSNEMLTNFNPHLEGEV